MACSGCVFACSATPEACQLGDITTTQHYGWAAKRTRRAAPPRAAAHNMGRTGQPLAMLRGMACGRATQWHTANATQPCNLPHAALRIRRR
eukprot:350077-Chlamydomonas_euryale.AAC.3